MVFTLTILTIAILEGLVVLYDIVHPFKDSFTLASVQYDVPSRDVTVRPFLFEMHTAQTTHNILDGISQQIAYTLIPKVTALATQQYLDDQESIGELQLLDYEPKKPAEKIEKKEEPQAFNPSKDGKAAVAIVIDDMGIDVANTNAIIALKKPITASFLTYGTATKDFAVKAQNAGLEVMLHVPMMPHVPASLAPNTLTTNMSKEEVQKLFSEMLARYEGIGMRGVNNHMGSLFTENRQSMNYIMEILQQKKMFFLDSKTTGKSVARSVAAEYGVPYLARDVFLDNENDYDYVMGQLKQTEKIALKYGKVIAIGHPHTQTVKALTDWVKDIEQKNIKLVHISDFLAPQL